MLRYGQQGAGAQRIARMVASQLEAAGVSQPRQWRAYRAFVFGYIDALADLQACNGGRPAQGEESRALSASVLRNLAGDIRAEELVEEFAEFVAAKPPACDEFARGRWSAVDDYEHWGERDMSGVATFIEAAHRHLFRLDPQPQVEQGAGRIIARNALLG